MNSLQLRQNTTGGALHVLQRQGQQLSIGSGTGILGMPGSYQQPGHAGSGRHHPAGPPGFEQGFLPAPAYAGGYSSNYSGSSSQVPGYSVSQNPVAQQYSRTAYPVNGYYNAPQQQLHQLQQAAHAHQQHHVVPRPPHGGPGFVGRGGQPTQPVPMQTVQAAQSMASSVWARGRGGAAVQSQQQVVMTNIYSSLDPRSRNLQDRDRDRERSSAQRQQSQYRR